MNDSPIQPARPEDAATLSRIAIESKAHWGYDEAFMALCRDELTITPADIARFPTFVLSDGGAIVGFYLLVPREAGVIELDYLYLLPAAIGRGHGRRLFEHAVRTARAGGYRTMHIQGDPNAAEFYRRMGAAPAGSTPSGSIPGRTLPFFHFDLGSAPQARRDPGLSHRPAAAGVALAGPVVSAHRLARGIYRPAAPAHLDHPAG